MAALVLKPEDPQREPGQNPSKYHEGIYWNIPGISIYGLYCILYFYPYSDSMYIYMYTYIYIYVYIHVYIHIYIYRWHSKGRMSIMVAISSGHPTWNIVKSAILRKTPPSLDVRGTSRRLYPYGYIFNIYNIDTYIYLIYIYIYKYYIIIYMVAGFNHLEKIWVRQWEGWHPIYDMENISHVWNHQSRYIIYTIYIYTIYIYNIYIQYIYIYIDENHCWLICIQKD